MHGRPHFWWGQKKNSTAMGSQNLKRKEKKKVGEDLTGLETHPKGRGRGTLNYTSGGNRENKKQVIIPRKEKNHRHLTARNAARTELVNEKGGEKNPVPVMAEGRNTKGLQGGKKTNRKGAHEAVAGHWTEEKTKGHRNNGS